MLVPLCVLGIVAARCGLVRRLEALPPAGRALAVFGLVVLVGFGGEKVPPQPSRVLELITVLRSGALTDQSGTLVSGIQARALQQFAGEVHQLADATAQVVEDARLDCVALTNHLEQADYSVAYIALDLPRGIPAEPNHNIMVGIEKLAQTATNVTAWVWFSEMPATNVNVRLDYSVREGVWSGLSMVTNHYPATESVNGVDCVRYCYALPPAIAGTPLRPQYEVEFGGFLPEEFLSVPETGVQVQVGEDVYEPKTGWVTIGEGADAIQIRLLGGIAVEAVQHGTNYVGNCLP